MSDRQSAVSKIDKSKWGPGPWQTEDDHTEWRFGDMPCMMHRHPRQGHWCGYVGVPPGHPWHGKNYDDVSAGVHGGLTYASSRTPASGELTNVWWLGFDCGHLDDLSPGLPLGMGSDEYRDSRYVVAEVERLAQQAIDAAMGVSSDSKKEDKMKQYVIARTYSAGVFAGTLVSREGKEAVLTDARRIWYWDGAASLSELAVRGTAKPESCKFPCPVPRVLLTEVIEILDVTPEARASIEAVPEWTAAKK